MRAILLLIAFLHTCYSVTANGKYPIQNFIPSDYKAGNQNIDFAQNRDLKIFVANNLGVLSYNGDDWEQYALRTGKKQRSLAFDTASNRLYSGSQGEFGYFSDTWNYHSLVEAFPEQAQDFDEVWDVFLLDDKVYYCTFQKIFEYDGQSLTSYSHESGFFRAFTVNAKLFVQSQNGQLLELRNGELVLSQYTSQSDKRISSIIYQDNGYLIFYNSGDIEFTNGIDAASRFNELVDALKGKYVNHVLPIAENRLVIATQTSGLFLFDMQTSAIEQITRQDGLASNTCLRSFQDYQGNLWVGMQNGLALIDINSPLRLVNEQIQLQGSGYDAYEESDGIYYSTSNGLYFAKKGQASTFIQGTEGPAYSLSKIAGKLYAGHHTGLWQVKQLQSNPDYAIGGTYAGLYLFKLAENELTPIQIISGFNESSRFFEEDKQGRIWVGQFYKGLFKLELSEQLDQAVATRMPGSNEIPINDQIIISRIDNELYLGTNNGIFTINESTDQITPSDKFNNEFGGQPIYLLFQDRNKNVHVISEEKAGLYKRISNQNFAFLPSSLYQLRYQLNNDLLSLSDNTSEGILFSGNEGFILYKPSLEERQLTEGNLVVSKLFSVTQDSLLFSSSPFSQRRSTNEKITVKSKAKVLQFTIESYLFNDITSHQFRYFLEGFDDTYSDWTNSGTKEYTNLKEGNYIFKAQLINHYGEIQETQPFEITVRPPIHRSLVAKILYVLLAVTGMVAFALWQQKRSNNRARKKIIEITQEKRKEVRKLEEEKTESELAHLNSLLAASTMNLVVKNEFIETIKHELNEVQEKGSNSETKSALSGIVKEIDSALHLQKDWEQFEHHFSKVHGDFLQRLQKRFVDLTPNEQKLCTLLRLNLNTKEISNLMSISQRGVEIARYRLRKKLGILKGQNLSKFILEY